MTRAEIVNSLENAKPTPLTGPKLECFLRADNPDSVPTIIAGQIANIIARQFVVCLGDGRRIFTLHSFILN